MSKIKGCKRCKYETIYHVDYEKSYREQKIYYTTDKVCCKCNYNPKYRYTCRTYKIHEMPLDKVTDDMNIDLSRIIHKHNHNKLYSSSQTYKYDNEHNRVETVLVNHYKCDFCGKISDYTETITLCKHIYDKIEYIIDYEKSAKEQKIYYTEIKTCIKCNFTDSNYHGDVDKCAELNNYPSDMNVDLSKIVHEHNHNKFDHIEHKDSYNSLGKYEPVLIKHYKCDFCGKLSDYTEIHEHNHNKFSHIEEKPTYNNEGNCIKLVFIKHYKCDFCDKLSDYTEIEECKDIYDKTKYKIDYKTSAQKQKIYYKEIKMCSKSKYIKPKLEYKIVELNNYPSNINVDLSKIVHEHNHNNIDYKEDKIEYDKEGNCIKLVLIKYHKCDFCDKIINEYTEIEEYDLNNPCKRMNEITKKQKEEIEKSNNYHNNYKYYDYDSGSSYDRKGGHYYTYHGEWISGY